ncbi:MAG: cytochrome c family protein [Planctomycetota bacterium]
MSKLQTTLLSGLTIIAFVLAPSMVNAQGVQCDPNLVMTAERCAKCHTSEVAVWKKTPHFQTYEQLSRKPKAKEICRKLGLGSSVKRSGVCIDCHFTTKTIGDKIKPVSGISCESCHGAAQKWIDVHSDYGGPTATRENESAEHAATRLQNSLELGMRNTRDLYLIASSCFRCHTVPNESLVNVGGHVAGTEDFELVRWSQGRVRHNFLRSGGTVNAKPTTARLRVMFVIGLMADLEYSTRATAKATEKSSYGLTVANRAATKAVALFEVQQKINDPNIQMAIDAFAKAELKINNEAQLNEIANQIKNAGRMFANQNDGTNLAAIDRLLPNESEYK